MEIRPFQLERYYGHYEFVADHHLSASDCESLGVGELLELTGTQPETLLDLHLGYTTTKGSTELRTAIAALYPNGAPEDVLVCNAPEEAIFLAMHALLEPGDTVVVQTPCYQSLKEIAASIGCQIREWKVRETNSDWQVDVDELGGLLDGARLLVTNAPHNPTGWMPTQAQWQEIAGLVETHRVGWFSDEMYRWLERTPSQEVRPAAMSAGGAVSLWGMSKTFGLPGLRVGWLVSTDHALLQRIETLKDYTSICSSAPSEVLATVALGDASEIASRNRKRIAGNEQVMTEFASRHGDLLSWRRPMAGPVSLARLLRGSAAEHADLVRTRSGALLVPSTLFDMDDRYLRIGSGRADFREAVDRWEQALAV